MSPSQRILFYSHNGVGVGHVQRQLKLAAAYRRRVPSAAVLLVTGSHAARTLDWPHGVDYVKLPSIRMTDRYENWEPREVGLPIERVMRLRSDLIRQAVRRFRPDVLVADFLPAGPYGELLPALEELAARGGRAIAGFRDVIDDPAFVRDLWSRTGVYETLRERYAAVCVYGSPTVVDFEVAYGLTAEFAKTLLYTGYLAAPTPVRGGAERLVLCTTGGGVDGGPLVAAFLDAVGSLRGEINARWLALTGPLLGDAEHDRLVQRGARVGADVSRVVASFPATLAAADAVVAMGGYNTACEIIASRTPALIVPRSGPSREQRIRADHLSRWGIARTLDPAEADPPRIADELRALLSSPPPPPPPVAVDGLKRAAAFFAVANTGAAVEGR